ncbi:hypothetical protein Plhal304r1_c054g0138661 [Plasmopara halstedii]
MRAVFSPFLSFFTSSDWLDNQAPPSVLARKSSNIAASHLILSGLSALIIFLRSPTG